MLQGFADLYRDTDQFGVDPRTTSAERTLEILARLDATVAEISENAKLMQATQEKILPPLVKEMRAAKSKPNPQNYCCGSEVWYLTCERS